MKSFEKMQKTESPQRYAMESRYESERLERQANTENELINQLLKESGIKKGMTGVDVGCGTGAITRKLAKIVGESGMVYGVDVNIERVRDARKRAQEEKISNTEFLSGDAKNLPMRDKSVDFTWAKYLVEYCGKEPGAIISEMARVTKSGGNVAIHDIDGWTFGGMDRTLDNRFKKVLAYLDKSVGLDLGIGKKLPSIFNKCGLADVKVYFHKHHFKDGKASPSLIYDWEARLNTLKPHIVKAFETEQEAEKFKEDMLNFLINPKTTMHTDTMFVVGRVPATEKK